MKEILIRPAFESDIPDILEITQEAFAKYAFDLGMPEKVKALKEDADAIRRDMAGKIVLIGQLDGVSVGSIRCQFLEGGMAYISRFGVKLAAQSCGIGGALIGPSCPTAKTKRCRLSPCTRAQKCPALSASITATASISTPPPWIGAMCAPCSSRSWSRRRRPSSTPPAFQNLCS